MQLPKQISPCPIKDAILEIRFTSQIHPNAVFGVIYHKLQSELSKVENLPILQLPEDIRSKDPNLHFKPYYRMSGNGYIVQIGPDVISINSYPEYLGWEKYSKIIFHILENIEELGIVESILRVGIRYINFFSEDIFNHINLNINFGNEILDNKNTVVRTDIEDEEFISTLQITNNANINNTSGSIIDIDTFKETELSEFFKIKEELINKAHLTEKYLFFKLLKEDYIKALNPVY